MPILWHRASVLIYITGVPGSGKSSVCEELSVRGYEAIDADDHIGAWVTRTKGETLVDPPVFSARTPQFYEDHLWRYEPKLAQRIATAHLGNVCFVGGCAGGEDEILHLFDRAFYLVVDPLELTRRLLTRTDGPFAHASQELRAAQVDRVVPNLTDFEAAWQRKAMEPVSSMHPVSGVVDDILRLCKLPIRTI